MCVTFDFVLHTCVNMTDTVLFYEDGTLVVEERPCHTNKRITIVLVVTLTLDTILIRKFSELLHDVLAG